MDYLMVELSAKPASIMLDCPYMYVYILHVDRAHHLIMALYADGSTYGPLHIKSRLHRCCIEMSALTKDFDVSN